MSNISRTPKIPKTPKLIKIQATIPTMPTKKRVAAYARVSEDKGERQLHSLSAQISHYSEFIQRHSEWEYVGVYADLGITGTSKDRAEYKRLLADCEAGNIDIILTKSISRFARNTVDLLETVRRLKEIGVEVRFERENISTMSGDGELMLTILGSFAQEEVRSLSDNVKWGTRKRFMEGKPNGRFRILGYQWQGDELVIVPEEAVIVKRIFDNFLADKSRLETERELETEGYRTRQGCVLRDSNIKGILTNITYTGNLLFQKEYCTDPITKRRKKNRGELPKYYIENTHEPIIDKAVFDYVQEEMARRKELRAFGNKSINTTALTSKIKCGKCGTNFRRKSRKRPNGSKHGYWRCGLMDKKGRGFCHIKDVPEDKLYQAATEVLGMECFDDIVFAEQVCEITVTGDFALQFHMADGSEIYKSWESTAKKDSWTDERRKQHSEQVRKGPRKNNGRLM